MTHNTVDVVVIGAGANGASVAYEATKRGLSVVLIDAGDIAGATSSRSTKLLHGGVRYLELAFKTLDFAQLRLVKEALIERSHWLHQAPFLAHRLELVLPSSNCFTKSYYQIGLGLYDALSGNKSIGRSRSISSSEIEEILPLLLKKFNGGIIYSDGQFNDARLNLLLALTAEKGGAIIRNYSSVIGFDKKSDGSLCGVISQNSLGEQEHWKTNVIVNATGINSDSIRKLADVNVEPRILTSRGVHLVLENHLCPKDVGLLIPSTDDGRVLFVLPFSGKTLIGTTDTPCSVTEAFQPSNQEKEYLLDHLKRWFPSINHPIVKSCWSGARPLIKPSKEIHTSSRVIREHEIETLPCGLISAMGGKWTTCRTIALDTLKAIEAYIGENLPKPDQLPLIGASQNADLTTSLLVDQKNELREYLPDHHLRENQLNHLQEQYGLEALKIIVCSKKSKREPLSDVMPICQAEINYVIKNEHAKTSTDVLSRRFRLAMLDFEEAQRILPLVQEELSHAGFPVSDLNLQA